MSFDKKSNDFEINKKVAYQLDTIKDNLDVKDYVLQLSEPVITVLNVYKNNNRKSFSDTMNDLCERNLEILENLVPTSYIKWITSLDEYINISSFNKNFGNVVLDYFYIPKNRYIYNKRNIYAKMDINYIIRIDNLTDTLIFKNVTRDIIVSYLICIDNFSDLSDMYRTSLKELFNPYVVEMNRFIESISNNCIKVNKMIIEYISSNGLIKPDIMLFLNYVDKTLTLYENEIENNDNNFIKNDEFKETFIEIKNIVDEQYNDQNTFLKKIKTDEDYKTITNSVNNIYKKIYNIEKLINKIDD